MKILSVFVALVLTACGTDESTDTQDSQPVLEPTAAPKSIVDVTVSQEPALVGVAVTFAFQYTAPIMGTALTPAVVLIEDVGIPLKSCSTKFIYKYGEDMRFVVEPGKNYIYRACLFDAVKREYVEGFGGSFSSISE